MSSIFGGGSSSTNTTQNTQQQQQAQGQQNTSQTANSSTNTNNTTAQNTSGTTGPGALSLPYLTGALQDAQGIYGNQAGNTNYNGQLYAGLNSQQLQALQGLDNYAMGTGTNIANAETGAGMGSIGSLEQGGALGSAIAGMVEGNPTQYNISNASAYANNPFVQSEITAANTPIQQELNENAIPGLNMSAVGTGNTDSSRAALQDAILQRDASTQESNNAANILNSNYATGLNLSQTATGQAEMAGAFDVNGLNQNGATGLGALGQGYTTGVGNSNIPLQTGTALQQNQQGQDTANYQQYAMNLQQPWTTLDNYFNLISQPYLGNQTSGTNNVNQNVVGSTNATGSGQSNSTSSGTSQGTSQTQGTTTQNPGLLSGLLGTASGVGSLFSSGGLFGSGGALGSLFSSPISYYSPTANLGGGNLDYGGGSDFS